MPTPAPATKKSLGKHHRFERGVISLLTARAEQEAGYTPGKMGWLAWFARIFRGESEQLQKFRHLAEAWPPLEREIFEMYFVDQLALADIARIVGCTSRVFSGPPLLYSAPSPGSPCAGSTDRVESTRGGQLDSPFKAQLLRNPSWTKLRSRRESRLRK